MDFDDLDVARKVPGLSGKAAMHARELLALRCLEGLAEMCIEAGASGLKVGLDLSQRCSVVLFHLTSEVNWCLMFNLPKFFFKYF